MYEKLSNEDIQFLEFFYDPTSLTECLYPINERAPHLWDEEYPCVTIRPYQFAMQNYSYMYADDFELSDKDNFRLKQSAGKLFNIAARNIGKSFLLKIDACLSIIHGSGDESCVASFDASHLKKVTNPICNIVRTHPFFEIFRKKGKNSGIKSNIPVEIETLHGHVCYGKNEKVGSPDPGTAYHGLHFKTFQFEEASYMSQEGTQKRIDSGASIGYIERLSGIPDLRVGSPLGEILKDRKNDQWICRLPQYVRSDWDKITREEQASKYGGKQSMAYKLNVESRIIEGAFGKWDIERIRKKCLKESKRIKFFEIGKDNFLQFKQKIIIDRLPAKQIIIASDIGTTGSPSEIAIFFGDSNKWKYHYQISLFKLTLKEQAQVFKWIYNRMGTAFISLDCSNADGRGIRDELLHMGIPQEHLTDFRMGKNLQVDFQKDEAGRVKRARGGQPLMREEPTKEFAVQLLEKLLYDGKIEIPYDEKFLREFSAYVEKVTANGRKVFGSSSTDHLVDTFLLFALCVWEKENKNLNNEKQNRCLGYM